MTATSRPHGRVGAQHQVKLRKWSDKIAREDETGVDPASAKRPTVRRQRPLDVAKKKLRKLFQ